MKLVLSTVAVLALAGAGLAQVPKPPQAPDKLEIKKSAPAPKTVTVAKTVCVNGVCQVVYEEVPATKACPAGVCGANCPCAAGACPASCGAVASRTVVRSSSRGVLFPRVRAFFGR